MMTEPPLSVVVNPGDLQGGLLVEVDDGERTFACAHLGARRAQVLEPDLGLQRVVGVEDDRVLVTGRRMPTMSISSRYRAAPQCR